MLKYMIWCVSGSFWSVCRENSQRKEVTGFKLFEPKPTDQLQNLKKFGLAGSVSGSAGFRFHNTAPTTFFFGLLFLGFGGLLLLQAVVPCAMASGSPWSEA